MSYINLMGYTRYRGIRPKFDVGIRPNFEVGIRPKIFLK